MTHFNHVISGLINMFLFTYPETGSLSLRQFYDGQVGTFSAILNNTVKLLNFRTLGILAVIYLKFKQRGQSLRYFIKMVLMK